MIALVDRRESGRRGVSRAVRGLPVSPGATHLAHHVSMTSSSHGLRVVGEVVGREKADDHELTEGALLRRGS